MKMTAVVAALVAVAPMGLIARTVQYPTIDPNYTQEIYTGPLAGAAPGMAWTASNNLLTRNGSNILEYSPTQNATHQGTSIHGVIAIHAVAGLSSSGYGMTTGTDGFIYTVTGGGLQRFNPSNWAAPHSRSVEPSAGRGTA